MRIAVLENSQNIYDHTDDRCRELQKRIVTQGAEIHRCQAWKMPFENGFFITAKRDIRLRVSGEGNCFSDDCELGVFQSDQMGGLQEGKLAVIIVSEVRIRCAKKIKLALLSPWYANKNIGSKYDVLGSLFLIPSKKDTEINAVISIDIEKWAGKTLTINKGDVLAHFVPITSDEYELTFE